MTAQPIEHEDPRDLKRYVRELPDDPERILRELPERERENFLYFYREAVEGAHDPAGWAHLRRTLRLWSFRVISTNSPGFYERQEAALNGTGDGMLLEDAVNLYRRPA